MKITVPHHIVTLSFQIVIANEVRDLHCESTMLPLTLIAFPNQTEGAPRG
jgi:hypothetical protein